MIYGRGRLLLDGQDVGEVEYKIEVNRSRGTGRGFLYGAPDIMIDVHMAADVKVRRGDIDFIMPLSVSTVDAEGRAHVLTNGDPGPETR